MGGYQDGKTFLQFYEIKKKKNFDQEEEGYEYLSIFFKLYVV